MMQENTSKQPAPFRSVRRPMSAENGGRRRTLLTYLLTGLWVLLVPLTTYSAQHIVMASTTSTENSGLFATLLPAFTKQTGIAIRVVAHGTGQAIETARRGDADVLFVHNRAAEERFVSEGWGLSRLPVMYNDFVVIGPESDPADVASASTAAAALTAIARSGAGFYSRGDNSGTHAAERRFWAAANVEPAGAWYRETGAGMGATLNTASAAGGYVLSDRGTWLKFANRGDLKILFAGDPAMFNPYGVIVVNPAKHPHVKAGAAQAFARWVTSKAGQQAIADYRINGEQAFFPNADN